MYVVVCGNLNNKKKCERTHKSYNLNVAYSHAPTQNAQDVAIGAVQAARRHATMIIYY